MKRLVLALSLVSTPAQAGQPIYESMAECAGIFKAMSEMMETQEKRDRLNGAYLNWAKASADEAGHDMTPLISEKAEDWRSKGAKVAFTQDFRDWTKYCRSLAKHKHLVIDPNK
ncbi:hypothetical protein [Litoreibacter janthinus]|uniref:Uncharacterized protein n=1 Tax=Litoreibacter janthinus TaxID=670154 RepID=A0A1I6HN31_9RHOB|nr:hypothetical protein [Litoreibacter janthinus]SFR55855.1 hypothetical protein SAMN04488002_3187 [Litoreibacter janthinus]